MFSPYNFALTLNCFLNRPWNSQRSTILSILRDEHDNLYCDPSLLLFPLIFYASHIEKINREKVISRSRFSAWKMTQKERISSPIEGDCGVHENGLIFNGKGRATMQKNNYCRKNSRHNTASNILLEIIVKRKKKGYGQSSVSDYIYFRFVNVFTTVIEICN